MSEIFLLDSNVFITPYRSYYSFDFAMGFWNQLGEKLKQADVLVFDVVLAEIARNEDGLSNWIKGLEGFASLSTRVPGIISNYGEVLTYIQNCGFYREDALREWSRLEIADPWLIAAAIENGATIITGEQTAGGLSKKNLSRNAKIPDVANHFNVRCENLFYFMRAQHFQL